MVLIRFVQPFLKENVRFTRTFEIAGTQVFIISSVNKVHDVMIFDTLLIGLHLELVVKNKPEHSFGDIFIDNFKPARNGKSHHGLGAHILLIFIIIPPPIVNIANVMKLFDFRVLNEILDDFIVESLL
jgi:hypothetical protein